MSLVKSDEEQRWVPTHVQVTVLRARGLRAKGKHGTSDVYTIIQLGKEKYSTCVIEKTTDPEWGEECSFELQPGVMEEGGRDAYPPGAGDLTLTVMHRALIGLDVFLVIHCTIWELQLTVQFTRHNLTASMYDLSMKDKPRSSARTYLHYLKFKKQIKNKYRLIPHFLQKKQMSQVLLTGLKGVVDCDFTFLTLFSV
uniref:C2 domain-containing protein n=1 Tax=Sinocyclocheilus anshuiensis TaxID=1608454 RepID=A0A671NG63_9TELE